MNFVNEGEFKMMEDIRNIERRICRFYLRVINEYYGINPVENKSFYGCENKEKLLLLCIQDTCLGLRKFYASLMEYKEIAKYMSKKKPMTIYCVQDESLFSALGVCIVIDEAIEKYGFRDKVGMKQIQLIVTEKDQNWRSLCSYIVERVNSCYKNVDITLELINERPGRLSNELFRTLREVDIVVMARYFSQFHSLTSRTNFLEVIVKRMKELSILFYLDTYHKMYKDTLQKLFSKLDTLIEIRNKKGVYIPLEDPRNKKHFLEFPFLFTTSFEDVMYSTCVKISGISYNSSAKKDLKNEASLLKYTRREIKRMISERFETENSPPLSLKNTCKANIFQAKTLKKHRKSPISRVRKSNQKTESARTNSKVSDYADNFSSTSPILSVCAYNKMRVTKNSRNVYTLPRSTMLKKKANLSIESEGANKLNTRAFKANKIVEKLIPMNLQNNAKYFEIEQIPNAKTIERSNNSRKVDATNEQIGNKHLNINKSNAEIDKRSERNDTLVYTNLQNKDKHSKVNKLNDGVVKARNACKNTVNTNSYNENKKPKVIKPKSGTAKSTKIVERISTSNLQNKNEYKCPYLSTKESVTNYAYYLAEIYYLKHFDRKKPDTPKFKSNKHLKN